MSTAGTKTRYTPDDLLTMPDGDQYELVDGNLIEKNKGFKAGRISGRIVKLLSNHCDDHHAGWVLPAEVGYQCFPDDPAKVRKPDVSFIRLERLAADQEPEGHCTIYPDLAVEVVSPNELFYVVAEKVQDYLSAGVVLVWVVDPAARTVQVHRADGNGTILRDHDELTGETVLPGFRCRVQDLFTPPTPRQVS